MNRNFLATTVGLLMCIPLTTARAGDATSDRLAESAAVFAEAMDAPDKSIPQSFMDKSQCVVVVPNLKKAALVVGAKYGKGFITCRTAKGWSAPGAVRIEGGSLGFQIGGSDSDVILLVMNERGADKLLRSKFTLGGEGEVAAGPVGRDAQLQTDVLMRAEIISWSRTRGIFAGISLQGATLRQDLGDNEAMYGRRLENRDIVTGMTEPPPAAGKLIAALDRRSPRRAEQ